MEAYPGEEPLQAFELALQDAEAEAGLLKAKTQELDNIDHLFALADFYLKRGRRQRTKIYAELLIEKYSQNPIGYQLL